MIGTYCECTEPFLDPDDDSDNDDGELGYCWACRKPVREDEE